MSDFTDANPYSGMPSSTLSGDNRSLGLRTSLRAPRFALRTQRSELDDDSGDIDVHDRDVAPCGYTTPIGTDASSYRAWRDGLPLPLVLLLPFPLRPARCGMGRGSSCRTGIG